MAEFDYDACDAVGLAELVRTGEASALELTNEAIRRIERVDDRVNAIVLRMFDEARRAAAGPLPEGPFRGVPFLLKDLRSALAGHPMRAGSRLFASWVPDYDAEIVRRYKAAGLVFVGKSATPEFGILPVTEADVYGPTRNPWNLGRTPGGSSGGAAAAVAAGIVPAAHGGDGGGSIRIHASCCGLFGLKPTRARVPCGPDASEVFFGFAIEHVITRTVRDSAAMLDVETGPEVTSLYAAPGHDRPFAEEVGRSPGKLRIALTTEPLLPSSTHEDCKRAAEEAGKLCASLGHEVEIAAPTFDGHLFARSFFLMFCVAAATELQLIGRARKRAVTHEELEIETFLGAELGRRLGAADFGVALRDLRDAQRSIARFFTKYDVLLTPTLAKPPVPIGSIRQKRFEWLLRPLLSARLTELLTRVPRLPDLIAERAYAFSPFTPFANVTGQPSMSVPLFWSREGLPIGSCFTGRFGEDATLIRLASQLEAAAPWAHRRAPVHAAA